MADAETTIYFVGTAGAGKSTLVAAYEKWCKQHAITTTLVNMDPGAEQLPYTPDVDIRAWVRMDEIMKEHGLGPNGAQVAAADMIALNLDEVKEELGHFRSDLVLIDTPGQIELFVFRQSGKHIVESLGSAGTVIAYVMDPFLARTSSGFASQMMLAATTLFRFQTPMVFLLSKADRIDEASLETIKAWAQDPMALEHDILAESPTMNREFATEVTRLLDSLALHHRIVPVSGIDGRGMDELYSLVQGAVGQGEDATPEFDTVQTQDEENQEGELN
jgi:GTPase SAR1 family protein